MAGTQRVDWLTSFQQYRRDLLAFLTRKLGCHDLAADCVQETYLRLVSLGPRLTIEHPRAFLFRIASNLAIDHLRRSQRQIEILSPDPLPVEVPSREPSAEDALHAKQTVAILSAAVAELSPKCRQALILNRLEGKSHAEIAAHLGVSESMVAKYIAQALKHCRRRLRSNWP
ncbi:MAG: sigma-70 family RNA polymerase sigma factor [Nitrospirota bacterium]